MAGDNKNRETPNTAKAASVQVPKTPEEALAFVRTNFERNLSALEQSVSNRVDFNDQLSFFKASQATLVMLALRLSKYKKGGKEEAKLHEEAKILGEYLEAIRTSVKELFDTIADEPDIEDEPGSSPKKGSLSESNRQKILQKIQKLRAMGAQVAETPQKEPQRNDRTPPASPTAAAKIGAEFAGAARIRAGSAVSPPGTLVSAGSKNSKKVVGSIAAPGTPVTAGIAGAGPEGARARAQAAAPESPSSLSSPAKPASGSRPGKSQPPPLPITPTTHSKSPGKDKPLDRASPPGAAATPPSHARSVSLLGGSSLPGAPLSVSVAGAGARTPGSLRRPPSLPTTPQQAVKTASSSEGSASGQSPASAPATPTKERKLPPPLPGHGRSASVSVSPAQPVPPPKPALGRLSLFSLSAGDSTSNASPPKQGLPSPTQHQKMPFPPGLAALSIDSKNSHTPPKPAVPASPTRPAPKRPAASSDNTTPPRPPAAPDAGASAATLSVFMQEDQRTRAASAAVVPAVVSSEQEEPGFDGPIG